MVQKWYKKEPGNPFKTKAALTYAWPIWFAQKKHGSKVPKYLVLILWLNNLM